MSRHPSPSSAFTLVELMVSTSILALIMAILLQMTGQTANTWRFGAAKVEQFQEARKGFEAMTRRLSDATLNTYWDYSEPLDMTLPVGGEIPSDYVRQSDLRFRVVQMADIPQRAGTYRPAQGVFFQAPFGNVEDPKDLGKMDNLLNSWGYFVEVEDTGKDVPKFLAQNTVKRIRPRLMEYRQETEHFSVYEQRNLNMGVGQVGSPDPVIGAGGTVGPDDDLWFTTPINRETSSTLGRPVRVLAENILAVIILPRLTPADEEERRKKGQTEVLLSPNFSYHSKQLNNYNKAALRDKNTGGQLNPKNQLPPMVQVAMFALDEVSAERLAFGNNEDDLGISELLQGRNGGLFTDAEKLEHSDEEPGGDLGALEKKLIEKRLSYRLFTSNVAIRGAKWSSATTK